MPRDRGEKTALQTGAFANRTTMRFRSTFWSTLGGVLSVVATAFAQAGEPAPPLPYFASLASSKVYMREGPTYRHSILWVYHRKGLPVEVLARYDVWRRVRDADGTTGWIHSAMISDTRTVIVVAKTPVPIRRSADPHSPILALAQHGVVAKLEACAATACEIDAAGAEGWIEKRDIWGIRIGEVFH